ncbi:MAG: GNAT family N-acetyltransferase [Chitinophagales bacterium]|nr:GNAT family N-acetyltransferase [Chitinophagales bacterium]
MYQVKRYTTEYKLKWNEFLQKAKNGSFLFNRDFMDYHADRFQDYSLLICDGEHLAGIIPANISGNQIISHQGLTYGGLVVEQQIKLNAFLKIFSAALKYLSENKIELLFLKTLPQIYTEVPSDEVEWALFILKAKLHVRNTTLSIDQNARLLYQERRRRSIKKAQKISTSILGGQVAYKHFWEEVLVPNMLEKHGLKPIHTLEEIELLASRFPDNIKQYNIYIGDTIMAGCTMFLNKTVAHAQYISGSFEGRSNGCLDLLFDFLIDAEFKNYRYFDFGTCNEDHGLTINHGLLDWKEGFGARAISQDLYQIETANYPLLEQKIKPNE